MGSCLSKAGNGYLENENKATQPQYLKKDSSSASVTPITTAVELSNGAGNRQQSRSDQTETTNGTSRGRSDMLLSSYGQESVQENRQRQRRGGADAQTIREQVRRMGVGGPQSEQDRAQLYEVSSSDASDADLDCIIENNHQQPEETTAAICKTLQQKFLFQGIPATLLSQVVQRMKSCSFSAGETILQQGEYPGSLGSMYYLEQGTVKVIIFGSGQAGDEQTDGATTFEKTCGWVFGDLGLLFDSPRSASVVAVDDVRLWSMSGFDFRRWVVRHSPGARRLRFVRKLPLLKGLSDNTLVAIGERMTDETYEHGQKLIQYGESGTKLYLIRSGRVQVMRPLQDGQMQQVAILGRGQFVGERTVVTGRLRSADCVANGRVQVVVMNKKDYLALDNPLLSWMLDYDAAGTVLKSLPSVSHLKQEDIDAVIDLFETNIKYNKGQIIVKEGDILEYVYIIKTGEVNVYETGQKIQENVYKSFVKEVGGFSYLGDACIEQSSATARYTVCVKSDELQLIKLHKGRFRDVLKSDKNKTSLSSQDTRYALNALKKASILSYCNDDELAKLIAQINTHVYNQGQEIGSNVNDYMAIIKQGQAKCKDPQNPSATATYNQGSIYGEKYLLEDRASSESLIACSNQVIAWILMRTDVEECLGNSVANVVQKRKQQPRAGPKIKYEDLQFDRIVGVGNFGHVRVVKHKTTNKVYALKVMFKANITETKQTEHVQNERATMQSAGGSPFCVQLIAALQDERCLYMIQEWVPGGELFHHLDREGPFTEDASKFYAANVVLALQYLHQHGIVYRDLKPENILLDSQGYLKLTDFGFAKFIGDGRTVTVCGTPDYQAPETIRRQGSTKAVDYWALGVLIFEMLVGDPPFKPANNSSDPWDTFRRTLNGRYYVPDNVSDDASDLIRRLLRADPSRRLGTGASGVEEIKRHRWFKSLSWDDIAAKKAKAPIIPPVSNPLDTQNFEYFDGPGQAPRVQPDRVRQWDMWDMIQTNGQQAND